MSKCCCSVPVQKMPLFIAFCILCLTFSVYAKDQKPRRSSPVVVTEAQLSFLAPTVMVPGTVISRQEAVLPAEVAGRLIKVAEIGTVVKRGDSVAHIDDTLYKLRAKENSANLKREQARLTFIKKELVRFNELALLDHSTKTQLDKLQLDKEVAVTELVLIKAKIQVDQETLSRYIIRAPFDGVVTAREKREGEWIGVGQTSVRLSNPDELEIVARVPEKSMINLRIKDRLSIRRNGEQFQGIISTIVPVGNIQSHLYEIRLKVSDTGWLAGQVVRIDTPVGKFRDVIAVERDALVLRHAGISVFRINEENIAEKVNVTTGIASGRLIEVSGDIKAGDKIVIRGGERLRPGAFVQVKAHEL